MNRRSALRHAACLALAVLAAACGGTSQAPAAATPTPAATPTAATAQQPVAVAPADPVEGERVARRVGCLGCHGKDAGGQELWAEAGKFKLRSANITQAREHYDDAAFAALLREGRTHDGHVPAGMPVNMYQHLSDREVRDLTAWVRALPAVDKPGLERSWFSPEVRRQIEAGTHEYSGDWRADPGNVPPAAPPAGGLELGRHLAMTSCPECHGPDLNGFEGDATPPLVVAKGYSDAHFLRLMRTGITAAGTESKSGLMSEVARGRFSVMTDAEIAALKDFLDAR